ncbi:MAG: 2,3-bisphosphoglycerate-independent phosphoglycerate mutase [Phycisphaerales bacterium]|nr:MAG: 2,3-bisphosphoglycerate-independent phosphoglycerate mutase [Phycisphaerales bacterium]
MTASTAKPTVLIVRDGWGENPNAAHDAFNAIKLARTPVDDQLRQDWPHTLIKTSGVDAGLPPGTMGNSEVGHQNIGAGRIVDQEVMRITRAIHDGSFFENAGLRGAFEHAAANDGCVHLLGLLSDGQVHSDIEHLFALLDLAKRVDFPGERVVIHIITDGRDVGPKTALGYLDQLESKMREIGIGRIASVCGRYYAMDRDHRWERTALAYRLLTGREVAHEKFDSSLLREAPSARAAIEAYYENPTESSRTGDEFINPTRIMVQEEDSEGTLIGEGDAVIFYNFRGDRPRQITKAFTFDDEAWANVQGGGFARGDRIRNLYFCAMTGYEEGLPVNAIAFKKPPKMRDILGQVVSAAGRTQFRCAETEKFAHVTFFFNDYREEPFEGEGRKLCPSPQDVSTYDQKPEMSAREVCREVLQRLAAEDCEDLLIVNFANPDMVGHTGNLDAVIKAVEVVDECVGQIVRATLVCGGALIVTADHGNAEQMWSPENDSPHTAHTTYDVPLLIVGEAYRNRSLREGGRLADIAPTLLEMMGLAPPNTMTGRSLWQS